MIDLTKDVSPAVLAQTAAKLEAEQKQRDKHEAQKELAEARKPFEARMVSCPFTQAFVSVQQFGNDVHSKDSKAGHGDLRSISTISFCLCAHGWLLPARVGSLPIFLPAHVGLLLAHAQAQEQQVSVAFLAFFAISIICAHWPAAQTQMLLLG